ncbi:MAG: tyrosine-type recombinase/integrase [Thermoplasmata archaeon]
MDDLGPLTIDGFLERRSTAESTKAEYRNKLTKCERLIGKPLARATPRDLATLKARLRPQLSGPEYVRVLRTFYRAGGRPDLAELCAMKQRNRVLGPGEILSVRDVQRMIEKATTLRNRALIGALWDSGARISELLAVDLGRIRKREPTDGIPLTFALFLEKTKTGPPRDVTVVHSARTLDAWLKAHPYGSDSSAPLFANADGSRLSRKRAWAVVTNAARKAGFGTGRHAAPGSKHVWVHLFRHSRATDLLRKHMSEGEVKTLLGWTPRSTMLSKYGHLTSDDARRALLRAEGFEVALPEESERITIEDDQLVPVVPSVIPSGAHRAPQITAEMAALLEDPKVRAFVLSLSAMRKATSK